VLGREPNVRERFMGRMAAGLAVLVLVGGAAACGDDDDDDAATNESPDNGDTGDTGDTAGDAGSTELTIDDADLEAVATTYADLVYAAYDDAVSGATDLQTAVGAFLDDPTDATLEAAKQAWLDARDLYGPTEVFRFYDGPIDDPDDGPEGQINAWPLDEAYIDYVDGDPSAGIVNDTAGFPEITAETLVAANEAGGETNISTGWHAIEFLLWGQDLSDTGPGERPVTDYTTSPTAERRATYLRLVTDLLVTDMTGVRDAWSPDDGDYRAELLADPDTAVSNMLRGMGALSAGELGGERVSVAYETKDQEDEHSCFSDNTTNDVLGNARGIRMVYLADHEGVDGTSLSEVVAGADPDLDQQLRDELDASVGIAEGLEPPFDQLILGEDDAPGRTRLLELIEALDAQGDTIAELATRLGYQISLEV
jgi:putative iron-regulated protein